MADILVVDDEVGIRNVLAEILNDAGYVVKTAADAEEARQEVAEHTYSLILLDIWMPGTDGISLLREWSSRGQLKSPVIMMSGHGTIDAAMQAVREGAMDFLEKPISLKVLLTTIQRVLSKWATLQREKALELERRRLRDAARSVGAGPTPPGQVEVDLPIMHIPECHYKIDFNRPYREALLDFERAYFMTVLHYRRLSITHLSRHSGMERTHLYRKLRSIGIDLFALRGYDPNEPKK